MCDFCLVSSHEPSRLDGRFFSHAAHMKLAPQALPDTVPDTECLGVVSVRDDILWFLVVVVLVLVLVVVLFDEIRWRCCVRYMFNYVCMYVYFVFYIRYNCIYIYIYLDFYLFIMYIFFFT